ncbi:TRAP transporter small permease [Nisaea sediminum]|uniref:TRAP transporter small permease n=1 Tax=Nisaea sediminum TaxID=2775867 RepID=UPI0018660A25|nr:TRAP transporter small permease [Nisaea sediminum]
MTNKILSDRIEELTTAAILGAMTLITFANVIARYVFDSGILWALEVTVFLFGWLVLLGAAYAVKTRSHLGVDVLTNGFAPGTRRVVALVAAAVCIFYAFLLFKGAWDYWANFANLPATEGRWFPLGFETDFREKGWYETEDTPMPEFFGIRPLDWLQDVFNAGERYEKIPRLVPYFILPLATGLLLIRFVMAGIAIWRGRMDGLIASHEAEEAVEEAAEKLKDC